MNEDERRTSDDRAHRLRFLRSLQDRISRAAERTFVVKRDKGIREIRDFTVRCTNLIIIDPYLFSWKKSETRPFLDELSKSARLRTISRLHTVYTTNDDYVTRPALTGLRGLQDELKFRLSEARTSLIHDRIWICDRRRAIAVGTSLNGIGSRACFILPLPDADLQALLTFLDRHDLARKRP